MKEHTSNIIHQQHTTISCKPPTGNTPASSQQDAFITCKLGAFPIAADVTAADPAHSTPSTQLVAITSISSAGIGSCLSSEYVVASATLEGIQDPALGIEMMAVASSWVDGGDGAEVAVREDGQAACTRLGEAATAAGIGAATAAVADHDNTSGAGTHATLSADRGFVSAGAACLTMEQWLASSVQHDCTGSSSACELPVEHVISSSDCDSNSWELMSEASQTEQYAADLGLFRGETGSGDWAEMARNASLLGVTEASQTGQYAAGLSQVQRKGAADLGSAAWTEIAEDVTDVPMSSQHNMSWPRQYEVREESFGPAEIPACRDAATPA